MGGPSSRRPRSPRLDSEIFWSIYRISDWATQRPGYPVPKTHVEREALNTPRHIQPQRSTRRRSEAESSAIHPMPVEELECVAWVENLSGVVEDLHLEVWMDRVAVLEREKIMFSP